MSTNKHKSFRKVLQVERSTTLYNGQQVKTMIVLWCFPESFTLRTVKTNHIGITCYMSNGRNFGINAWLPRKAVSINLKNPFDSKFFIDKKMKSYINDAGCDAFRKYVLDNDSRCKGLTGKVLWFSDTSGCIEVQGQQYRVYACNIKGAKTWYPETACMFLKQGDTVTVNLSDMGDHLTCSVTAGGIFDAEKWASLDHSKLAFRCDDSGQALNGLFQ